MYRPVTGSGRSWILPRRKQARCRTPTPPLSTCYSLWLKMGDGPQTSSNSTASPGTPCSPCSRTCAAPLGRRTRAEEKYEALKRFSRDLTELARRGKLDPVIGRDDEIRRVIQVLSRRTKNNPV